MIFIINFQCSKVTPRGHYTECWDDKVLFWGHIPHCRDQGWPSRKVPPWLTEDHPIRAVPSWTPQKEPIWVPHHPCNPTLEISLNDDEGVSTCYVFQKHTGRVVVSVGMSEFSRVPSWHRVLAIWVVVSLPNLEAVTGMQLSKQERHRILQEKTFLVWRGVGGVSMSRSWCPKGEGKVGTLGINANQCSPILEGEDSFFLILGPRAVEIPWMGHGGFLVHRSALFPGFLVPEGDLLMSCFHSLSCSRGTF